MKILYISADFYPPVRAAAIRAQFNVAALREAGEKVIVITCNSGESGHVGVVTVSLPPPSNSLRLLARLFYELKLGIALFFSINKHYHKGDVLIFSSPPFFSVSFCVLTSICLGRRYILEVRDRYPKVFVSLKILSRKSVVLQLMEWWERVMYRNATALATVTYSLCKEITKESGVSPYVVRNGFDENLFLADSHEETGSSRVVIVTHGVFGRFFDLDSFLYITRYCADKAKSHEFLLIGYGPKLDRLKSMNLPNVRIIGESKQHDIAKLLRKSHIGFSLHMNDESMLAAFPVKIFEFIGSGLPMLVIPKSEAGCEIESQGMGWCFEVSQIEAASQRLVEMIDSTEMRCSCRKNVVDRRSVYSRQEAANQFSNLVRSCRR